MLRSKSYGLQKETRQYLRRLYAYGRTLAGPDIADIDDFVKGLKQLGLWQNTVCWPMRSIHNIGTGSLVLSLGGGGKYDGTMVNSPAWNTNGIYKAVSSTGYLATTYDLQVFGSAAFFFNTISNSTSRSVQHFGHSANTSGGLPIVFSHGGSLNLVITQGTTSPTTAHTVTSTSAQSLNQFYSEATSWTPSTASLFFNGNATISNGAYSNGPYSLSVGFAMTDIIILGAYANATPQGCETLHSFGSLFNTVLTATQHGLLYNLYKNTIGKGLGLI